VLLVDAALVLLLVRLSLVRLSLLRVLRLRRFARHRHSCASIN
jgi:hypothetical protein